MNYTINEIPDEAVELSGTEMIPIWQGETKKVSVATLASSGIPVGAVMPFANGTTSKGWLLCDGRDTTGTADELQTHYPALYTYLGNSNVLPAQFDHNRLGDYEGITLSTISSSPTIMQYDGVLYVFSAVTNSHLIVYVNGVSFYITDTNSGTIYTSGTIPFKKGDSIYYSGQIHSNRTNVAYYKQPLYIKAT